MNDLLETEFFSLLADTSQEVTTEKMQNAYAQFVVHMEAVSNSEDYTRILRTLNLTRIEMAHLQTVYRYEQGEKCPEKSLPIQVIITD